MKAFMDVNSFELNVYVRYNEMIDFNPMVTMGPRRLTKLWSDLKIIIE